MSVSLVVNCNSEVFITYCAKCPSCLYDSHSSKSTSPVSCQENWFLIRTPDGGGPLSQLIGSCKLMGEIASTNSWFEASLILILIPVVTSSHKSRSWSLSVICNVTVCGVL